MEGVMWADEPLPEELAESTALLAEWDQLRVRDYYDGLTVEVLGSKPLIWQRPRQAPEDVSGVVLPFVRPAKPRARRPDHGEAA
jgi:hypothetical protein